MPVTTPGWVPPGQSADESRYRYDLKTGWVPPGEKSAVTRSQVLMPPGFDPREDDGFEIVVSPPGQKAPEGISYTPATDEIHGLGEQPPIQRTNYTIIPAGSTKDQVPAGTPTTFPMPEMPPGPPMGGPGPGGVPSPPPPAMGGGIPPGRMPPPVPPLNLSGGGAPPPGLGGGPPTGAPMPPPGPAGVAGTVPLVGGGQDSGPGSGFGGMVRSLMAALIQEPVGVGEDVGVGASTRPMADPAYVRGISQNDLPQAGISAHEAAVMCGPAAALFMTRMGRTPTREEAQTLRQQALDAGWSGRGMGGTGAFQNLARRMGISVETGPADQARIAADATAGLPVVISTPEHYWQISDYNASNGKFLVGDAVGGNREMTLEEIRRHPKYGGPLTAIYTTGESRAIDREPSAMAGGRGDGYRTLSAQNQGTPQGGGAIDTSSREAYIRSAMPYFRRVEQETGIPAEAMAALSINEGVLSRGTFAHDHGAPFGIKSFSQDANGNDRQTGLPVTWTNAWEVTPDGRNTTERSAFIRFPDPVSSIQGFVDFLGRNKMYRPALDAARRGTNTEEFIRLLHYPPSRQGRTGYATDPAWTTKVVKIANQIRPLAQGIQASAQGAAQAAINIPQNILSGARSLIDAAMNATASPAYAAEEGVNPTPGEGQVWNIIPPEQVPPANIWNEAQQREITRRAQGILAANPDLDPQANRDEVWRQAAQEHFTVEWRRTRPANAPATAATAATATAVDPNAPGPRGRAGPSNSPTPSYESLTPDQKRRVDAARQQWSQFGMDDDSIIRIGLGLPSYGTGAPGTPATYNLNGKEIITGIYGPDGNEKPVNGSIVSYQVREATGQLPAQRPITVSSGGYSFHQVGGADSNDWLVGTRDGSLGRVNLETGEVQPMFRGTPEQRVEIRNNPSGTGTQVWVTDNQGNATLASNNVDEFAATLKRFEPHVSTANGVTTTVWTDRATGEQAVSRDRDPLGQPPSVRTVGNQLAVTSSRPNAEGTGYTTDVQYSQPPIGEQDVYRQGIRRTPGGTMVTLPGYTDENGKYVPMREVPVPGTRGDLHYSPQGPIYRNDNGVPTQVGETPARRQWFQVRDPFGGIGMTDRATGDFVPIRQAAPKIVRAGDRYIMLTPPRLRPMKGVGSKIENLGELPWQVRNLSPRAMAMLQEMLSGGAGTAPSDVPPGGAAPPSSLSQGAPQAAGGFPPYTPGLEPLPMQDMTVSGDAEDATGPEDADMMPEPTTESLGGLADVYTYPGDQGTEDYTDVGDTGTIGYDDELDNQDMTYSDQSYGDEEDDTMNRRRRVGAGQSYDENDRDYIAAVAARNALTDRGSSSGYGGMSDNPGPGDPYDPSAQDFSASVVGMVPKTSKGYSHIKGDDGSIYSFNEDTGELAGLRGGSGLQEREMAFKERQSARADARAEASEARQARNDAERNAISREELQIAKDPRKFRLQPHMIDLGRGGQAVYDPETGMVQQVTPREPGDVRGIGRDIYVPAGQSVDVRYANGNATRIQGGPYSGWVPTRNTPGLPFGASAGPAGSLSGGNPGGNGGGAPGGYGGAGAGGYSGGMGSSGYGRSSGGAGYGSMGSPGGFGGYGGGAPAYGGGPGFSPGMSRGGPPQGWSPDAPMSPGGQGPPPPPGWVDYSGVPESGMPYDPSMGDMGRVQGSFRPTGWDGPWPGGRYSNGPGAIW